MAVKWSTPGIKFTEIDNTIQTDADPGQGIGAIVIKSNKGPVNMRVLSKTYGQFVEHFGEPENLDDYGHFAAENFLSISNQLLAVRATMGDEQYSQVQFSFPEASISATNVSEDTAVFKYVDNIQDNDLVLLQPLSAVVVVSALTTNNEWIESEGTADVPTFTLHQGASYGAFQDIYNESIDTIVYKNGENNNVKEEGYHLTFPSFVEASNSAVNVLKVDSHLTLTSAAWNSPSAINTSNMSFGNQVIYDETVEGAPSGRKVSLTVPGNQTLNGESYKFSFIADFETASGWKNNKEDIAFSAIFNKDAFYPAGSFSGDWDSSETVAASGYGRQEAIKMQIIDWDDVSVRKTYYLDKDEFSVTSGGCSAIKFKEFNTNDYSYSLIGTNDLDGQPDTKESFICSAVSAIYAMTDPTPWDESETYRKLVNRMSDEYGCNDPSEIMNNYYLRYWSVYDHDVIEKIVKSEVTRKDIQKELFWMYSKTGEKDSTIVSVFDAKEPELAIQAIQSDYKYTDPTDLITSVNPCIATPTSYIFNSTDKTYEDGYTILTQTEDEPGNGDLENYVSNFDNQLIIASIGPGKYGDDIGVSIITTECADIAALNHQNAFNWKYTYDDEDQVDNDDTDYTENPLDLTWKKVFRINVYTKTKTQTAKAAWGSGMDALLKDPAESWMVSMDPMAKDSEGNSLYAPTVINGHSDYIYVSRASVTAAKNTKGQYEQPNQTYSIYQLTGGKNSTKNNITEKTAALKLYADRRKADFDILFNVEAVDTFNGRFKFMSHQKKIAEIAGTRTMDIGVVQTTSKKSKTVKEMISETKMFSFNNPTYVAEYGGYDKYYNGTLASWIYLPKSVAGACAMAYCDVFAYPWMAPAGTQRGSITYTAGQLKKLTDDEIGQLYDNNCNTSRECGAFGEILWGQKTALKKVSSLNRINVRRCMNYIEKQLENALVPYLFQQNTPNTRSSAKNVIDSFLNRVKAAEGILSFSTSVTQDPEDAHIMNVNIHVVPAEAIEFIDVKISIDRNTGVTVAEE